MAHSAAVVGHSEAAAVPGTDPGASLQGAFGGALLLSTAAASVCSALALSTLDVGAFVSANRASPEDRRLVLLVLLAAFGLAFAVTGGVALLGGERRRVALRRMGHRLSPLSVAYLVPVLLSYRAWSSKPLPFLLLLVATTVVVERTLRLSLAAGPGALTEAFRGLAERVPTAVRRFGPVSVVLLGCTGYATFAAYYSIQQHHRLATLAFDLGIYDNLLYNALHGFFFRSPVLFGPNGGNYITGHAELIMLAYVPIYALWPRAEMLLVMQACLLGFAAFPLYKFARTQLPPWTAVVVALGYLLYAPMHGPTFYDFHWLPTAMFFHFWLYFGIATQRRWLSVACVVVLLLVREDVSVGLTILGTFLALTGIRVRFGIGLAVAAVAYFVVMRFVIMPRVGSWTFTNMYKDLIPVGESGYGAVIRTIVTNPPFFLGTLLSDDKLVYALHLFAPVALLPWRRVALALLASAGFFFTLMTTGYAPTLSIAFQYTTHWIPYVFAATVLSLRLLGQAGTPRRRAATGAFAFAMLIHSVVFGAVFQHETFVGGFGRVPFSLSSEEKARHADMMALVQQIPKEASVAATESELPHVSSRLTAYALREAHGGADFLLVNKHMVNHLRSRKALTEAFAEHPYGLVEKRGVLYLFRKDHSSPGTSAARRELGLH